MPTTPNEPNPRKPITTLLDALGKRWALRILWELRSTPLSFRALQSAADNVSPSVLNTRLHELRALGIVEHTDMGYALTESGREFGVVLMALNGWAQTHL